jgi:hypothetical protein
MKVNRMKTGIKNQFNRTLTANDAGDARNLFIRFEKTMEKAQTIKIQFGHRVENSQSAIVATVYRCVMN